VIPARCLALGRTGVITTASEKPDLTVTLAVPAARDSHPPPLIKIHPEWRGHMYFVVGDQIIVVDRNHRIIAIIESEAAHLDNEQRQRLMQRLRAPS
jgi:hypothetical protein